MSYHDISLISILRLHGTLHVQKAGNAEGVSVQTEGPYEAKVVDGSWLMIYPEGQEPQFPLRSHTDLTSGRTHVGSTDVTARWQWLTDAAVERARARASARVEATVRITAPRGTKFELIRCDGMRKGPYSWHFMRGNDRFRVR
jgi:hypothetical protein